MNKTHAKSLCCEALIHRFGNRRRQCSECKKTWRIRKKTRGRKKKRETVALVEKYLRHEIPSLYAISKSTGKSADVLEARLNRSRDGFLKHTPWPPLPRGMPLIAIADAMVQWIEGTRYSFYFILLRPTTDHQAVIVPPIVRQGTEDAAGWEAAFARIPLDVQACIEALVCDGRFGLMLCAKHRQWIIQRCQFHLIARLQLKRSKWSSSRHSDEGHRLYTLVKTICTTRDTRCLSQTVSELEEIAWHTKQGDLKTILHGFVNHYEQYRSYLMYPTLNLPTTSNAIEALIGGLRNLSHRARGFRTRHSFMKWISAYLKSKRTFTCNGFRQPN